MNKEKRIQVVTANQMRALGEGSPNFDLVVKILASMPKSYSSLSSLMEETKDLRTVTFAEVVRSLETHEK
uniref:Retrovirus-related Pol polyprotein from transposon TNT 1-94 n=1 Tax=Noccaea caerulescens TaxID=107243 RepID=A0A1J3FD46_NOCCA